MSLATKHSIAEQVKFRLEAGWPDVNAAVGFEDVYQAIEQKINALFKMEHFNITLPSGETVPNNAMLSVYDGDNAVSVTSLGNGRSKAILPVQPISLPRSMGVYEITDPENNVSFIPLLLGQRLLLKSQPLINDLLGQVGWEPKGKYVEFTKDVTLLGISTVNMVLAVFDISSYDASTYLPIPSDKLEQIVNELVQQFAGSQELANAKGNNK